MTLDLEKLAQAMEAIRAAVPGARFDPSFHDVDAATIAALKSLGGCSYVGTFAATPEYDQTVEWDVVYFQIGNCSGSAFGQNRPKGSAPAVVPVAPTTAPVPQAPIEPTDWPGAKDSQELRDATAIAAVMSAAPRPAPPGPPGAAYLAWVATYDAQQPPDAAADELSAAYQAAKEGP